MALTDFMLTVESFLFAFCVSKKDLGALKSPFLIVFAAFGLASLTGGVLHGFLDPGTGPGAVLWWATLLGVGLAGCGFALVGARLLYDGERFARARRVVGLLYGVYFLCTLGERRFWLAILFYVPATLLTLLGFLTVYRNLGERRTLIGIAGLVLSLAAPAVQQLGVSLHPVYLTYNAFYHVILMISLALLFAGLGGHHEGSKRVS